VHVSWKNILTDMPVRLDLGAPVPSNAACRQSSPQHADERKGKVWILDDDRSRVLTQRRDQLRFVKYPERKFRCSFRRLRVGVIAFQHGGV
jgi:hypothetical protein